MREFTIPATIEKQEALLYSELSTPLSGGIYPVFTTCLFEQHRPYRYNCAAWWQAGCHALAVAAISGPQAILSQ